MGLLQTQIECIVQQHRVPLSQPQPINTHAICISSLGDNLSYRHRWAATLSVNPSSILMYVGFTQNLAKNINFDMVFAVDLLDLSI